MVKGLRKVLDRCTTGFPLYQKWLMTGAAVFYLVMPIDFVPELLFGPFGLIDDGLVIYVLVRVWKSPTLPPGGGNGSIATSRQNTSLASIN